MWRIKRKLHGVNHCESALACLLQRRPLVGAAQHVGCSVLCPGDGNTETPQTLERRVKAFLPSRVSRRRMSSALEHKGVKCAPALAAVSRLEKGTVARAAVAAA